MDRKWEREIHTRPIWYEVMIFMRGSRLEYPLDVRVGDPSSYHDFGPHVSITRLEHATNICRLAFFSLYLLFYLHACA